jgi:tetraprenyl-beta-curcumene synthase
VRRSQGEARPRDGSGERSCVPTGGPPPALACAHARYWATVAPRVRRELRRWRDRAEEIEDPVLREQAEEKLRDERANTEAIATLCTLAPRPYREAAVVAAVALQVMYDYLDAVSEHPVPDPIEDGRTLFRAFASALDPDEEIGDPYRYHPQREDGYLRALVESARESIAQLPGLPAVLPVARVATARFGEAQILSHAVQRYGAEQLRVWADGEAAATGLTWWEWAGGAAASILGVHALLAAAADERTTRRQARDIDHAYLLSSALTTMLDSLVDDERDSVDQGHRYIGYYPSGAGAAIRIGSLAERSVAAARCLPHAAHHVVTVAGIAAFYLSLAGGPAARAEIEDRVRAELRPLITPILFSLRLWRRVAGCQGVALRPIDLGGSGEPLPTPSVTGA